MKDTTKEIYLLMGKFLKPLTLERTYETIVKEGTKLTGATSGSLLLRKGESFERVYSTLPEQKMVKPRKRGFAYQAYTARKVVIIRRNQVTRYHPEFKESDLQNLAFIPLAYGKRTIGLLSLQYKRTNALTREQVKTLYLLGSIASLVIRKMQYHYEINKALETRDLFISLASHEFRTPLTSIKIYAGLIKRKLPKAIGAEKKLLENLLSSINRLTRLINEFLQMDQIKQGKLKYYWSEQSLSEVLARVIAEFGILQPDYRLVFENKLTNRADLIIADSDKLIEALSNLLNNAAKFSPKNSEIKMTLSYHQPHFLLSIKDRGTGIKKRELDKIFDRFYKGSSEKMGMGLGLYLAREIIHKHHGEIKIDSKINQGTTVLVILPQKKYAF